jgi:hypothetical protein
MKTETHRILRILTALIILSTGSGILSEAKAADRPATPLANNSQQWSSIESIIKERQVRSPRTVQAPADTHDGDPALLAELLDQGTRDVTLSMAQANSTASNQN